MTGWRSNKIGCSEQGEIKFDVSLIFDIIIDKNFEDQTKHTKDI